MSGKRVRKNPEKEKDSSRIPYTFRENILTAMQVPGDLACKDPIITLTGPSRAVIGRFFTFCLEKGEKGGKALQAKAGRGLFLALLLFVGIPLPGTGAWTGTLAASLLDMDFKSSVLAVMLGVLLAGIIMGAASAGLFGALFAVFS